jgi:hypothetical protein
VDASVDAVAPAHEQRGAGPDAALRAREQRADGYRERKHRFRELAERAAPRAQRARNVAGLAFLAAVVVSLGVLLGSLPSSALLATAAALLAAAICYAKHARLQVLEDEAWRSWQVNERGERRCRDAWRDLPETGSEFSDRDHPYGGDLDLFGPASLFQMINVAHTAHGRQALADLLTRPVPLADSIARQRAARALAPELELRQRLETLTLRASPHRPAGVLPVPPPVSQPAPGRPDVESLLEWAQAAPRFSQRRALVWAARLLPAQTLAAFIASQAFGFAPLVWKFGVALQVLLALHTSVDAKIVAAVVSHWQGTFSSLAKALRLVEDLELEAPLLLELRRAVRSDGAGASVELERLDRIVGWFALRNSDLVHAAINVLFAWDIHCVLALERWQSRSGEKLAAWLAALGRLEALCSVAGVAHDNPEFTFPELVSGPPVLDAVHLAHPLLAPTARIGNDVCLPGPGHALLVTGSNMSGKSTLLRAMGLASVMAYAGAPVCASRMRLGELRVHSSLHVHDSLADGVSRFYAELERLRAMLAAARGPVPVLYLIDEILAGTNSVERCTGARWVLGELTMAGALGAVSTHDAQLCQLPAPLMTRFEQVHFRESVQDATLTFDYRLHPGPVKAGNALRLMRSLGLAIP